MLVQELISIYRTWLLPYERAHPQDLNWLGPDRQWKRASGTYVSTTAPCKGAVTSGHPDTGLTEPGACRLWFISICKWFFECWMHAVARAGLSDQKANTKICYSNMDGLPRTHMYVCMPSDVIGSHMSIYAILQCSNFSAGMTQCTSA